MEIQNLDTSQIKTNVREIISRHNPVAEELIPILMDVNEELGYLPLESLVVVSTELQLPLSQIFSVASFYSLLVLEKRGDHVVQFCESAPCHVMGGRSLYQELKDVLGVTSGNTSSDGKWTIVRSSCLGICGVGPVIIIDDDIHGNITPTKLRQLLESYR